MVGFNMQPVAAITTLFTVIAGFIGFLTYIVAHVDRENAVQSDRIIVVVEKKIDPLKESIGQIRIAQEIIISENKIEQARKQKFLLEQNDSLTFDQREELDDINETIRMSKDRLAELHIELRGGKTQ